MQWCGMCIFLFLKSYNFIKGILCKYIVFLKKLRPLFLHLLINLFKYLQLLAELMYLSLNKLTSKYGKRIVLMFCIHCKELEESQSHHFPFIQSCFSFVSNATNFCIHSLGRFILKKKMLMCCWFSLIGCSICKYTY